MITSLYLGGLFSIASILMSSLSGVEDRFPLIEGTGIGSIALLLWAVRMLKQERDTALKNLEVARERIHSTEMKCLGCDYFRYNKLLTLVLEPPYNTQDNNDSTPALEAHPEIS